MIRFTAILIAVFAFSFPAQAHYKHHHKHHYRVTHRLVYVPTSESEHYLPHPRGCPSRAFCACGAAVEVFGSAIRSLWLASAWYRFPRTYPAPGMVGVRSHHVFVLREHVEGSIWLIADYNSGGHQSRLHQRSIAGYTIVNPHGGRYASM